MRRPILYLMLLLTVNCNTAKKISTSIEINPYNYSTNKKSIGKNGAVVSAHPLASKVGVAILRQGGNAFDAAIATQLALAVVYPAAGNIGGGGFMVAYRANSSAKAGSATGNGAGTNIAIDFREKAPAAATRDMYLDSAGNARTDLSQNGHLASGVPGTIAGIFAGHKYARLPFARLIQPAIDLAEKGFAITADEARSLNSTQAAFSRY